ncbi:sds23 moc1 [Cordyceps militaris]|uniref:Ribosome assembly protein 3 n=1 Tax=Cordyceps militaris TaxID=73501 RepID=A0A2H4SNX2_CORMI|nr:sds23 moc1 [Cordyceps militaris]
MVPDKSRNIEPTFTSSYLSDTQPSTTIGVYRGATQNTAKMPERDVDVLDEFISSYLQRLTTELSEDLDRVRNADDFRADSVPFLVHALVQGNYQFSRDDKERIVQASKEQKKEQKNMR